MNFFTDFESDKSIKIGISPLVGNISRKIHSHKAAWSHMIMSKLQNAGFINSKVLYKGDEWSQCDVIILEHGMEFKGSFNIFGGANDELYEQLTRLETPGVRFYSIDNDMPDVGELITKRLKTGSDLFKTLESKIKQYSEICSKIERIDEIEKTSKWCFGDSHSFSQWTPGYMTSRNDGLTLHGALNRGFLSYLDESLVNEITHIRTYMGNIDIRHHLMRRPEPKNSIKELIGRYAKHLKELQDTYRLKEIEVVGLLPIEDESRKLPKTGFYKGEPFAGTREERQELVDIFNTNMKLICEKMDWKFYEWPDFFKNDLGKLDFEFMEKPKSVHLSREYYRWDMDNNRSNINLIEKPSVYCGIEDKPKTKKVKSASKKSSKDMTKDEIDNVLSKSLNTEIVKDVGYFFNKVNERSEVVYGYRDKYNDGGDVALAEHVEYFHPHILYDDRMRYIMQNIVHADTSIDNIICNTIISHFYGGRGIHQILTREENPKKAIIDFERLSKDREYENQIRENLDDALSIGLKVYGTTELRTSLYGASNDWVASTRNLPKNADKINILLWVSSFIENGTTQKIANANSLKELYKAITQLPGVGSYYGYHCSTSNSVNPKINVNHDERFCVPGPGARFTLDLMFGDDCKVEHGDRVIWFRENYKDLIGEVYINPNEHNMVIEGQKIFKEDQNELKTYGCEVGLCQYGVYHRLKNNHNLINKRKVSRIDESIMDGFYNNSIKKSKPLF